MYSRLHSATTGPRPSIDLPQNHAPSVDESSATALQRPCPNTSKVRQEYLYSDSLPNDLRLESYASQQLTLSNVESCSRYLKITVPFHANSRPNLSVLNRFSATICMLLGDIDATEGPLDGQFQSFAFAAQSRVRQYIYRRLAPGKQRAWLEVYCACVDPSKSSWLLLHCLRQESVDYTALHVSF